MIRISEISMPINYTQDDIKFVCAKRLRIKKTDILEIELIKKSVDARKKANIHFNISVDVSVENESAVLAQVKNEKTVSKAIPYIYELPKSKVIEHSPVVVGSGPAGLFAALILAQCGQKPILLERGFDVDKRQKLVHTFWKTGILNTECNVQFGEGGAGTFSDGKLNTGTKDVRIRKVFEEFVECGALKEILYEAKPHIGTDKLASTVKNLRKKIISLGGTVIFNAKFCDFDVKNGAVVCAKYEKDGEIQCIDTENIILAVGHSSRDTFEMLYSKKVVLSQKNFSIGMRIEHLQEKINKSMYGNFANNQLLGAADYKLALHLRNGRSLYTFCMCPGGQVVGAASERDMVVTNGMSCFARDGQNANSGLLVGITPNDFGSEHPLAGIELQRRLERAAFKAGGGNYSAPVILVGDFLKSKLSDKFGDVIPTYQPNTKFVLPDEYLPDYVCESLRMGIPEMGKRIRGFDDYDAVLTGVESRSSSPIRIERDNDSCEAIGIKGLYPCGEGAGYAGGIVSSAVDGIKCAESILKQNV